MIHQFNQQWFGDGQPLKKATPSAILLDPPWISPGAVMRLSSVFAVMITLSLGALVSAHAPVAAAPGGSAALAATSPTPKATTTTCTNPNALGVARTVEIDTTGGPGFGFEHFRQLDFLRDKEVVLTFDDGPSVSTPAVLKALADQCVKAVFFAIGLHTTYYPEILKQVAEAGHTIGTHTWSHKDLSKKPYDSDSEKAKEEIEKAFSVVKMALGAPGAPFFRFPALKHPPDLVTYLGERNIAIFSD